MDSNIYFQWRSEPFEHFLPSSIFATVEFLCKLLADFLIQSFRMVLSWILLHRIWNYRLYIWRTTKSFHQNNTVKVNTLNIIWLQKCFYKEYCYLFKDYFNTDEDEEATFLIPPLGSWTCIDKSFKFRVKFRPACKVSICNNTSA